MNFSNSRRADPIIDITPMIDIVFQLVLFFMVTTTFATSPGIQVDLPKSSTEQLTAEQDELTVSMTLDGAVFLDKTPTDSGALAQIFQQRVASNPDTLVIIKADTGVPHGRVVAVMDLAKAAGLTRLAIATEAGSLDQPAP